MDIDLWKDKQDPRLFTDERYLMHYPLHVRRGFTAVSYYNPSSIEEARLDTRSYAEILEDSVRSFEVNWGVLDEKKFLHVLKEGKGRDRLVAIFAIGHSTLAMATEVLLPILESEDRLERCAAACVLGIRRDERALQVLVDYFLHDAIDRDGRNVPEAKNWYSVYYHFLAMVFATWGPPSITQVLKKTLLRIWTPDHEQLIGHSSLVPSAILYALGRRGALAVMHGVNLIPQRQQMALFCLALGHLRARERFDRLAMAVLIDQTLQREMISVWIEYFALSEEEAHECLQMFHFNLMEA